MALDTWETRNSWPLANVNRTSLGLPPLELTCPLAEDPALNSEQTVMLTWTGTYVIEQAKASASYPKENVCPNIGIVYGAVGGFSPCRLFRCLTTKTSQVTRYVNKKGRYIRAANMTAFLTLGILVLVRGWNTSWVGTKANQEAIFFCHRGIAVVFSEIYNKSV